MVQSLELHFFGAITAELTETRFRNSSSTPDLFCIRGKTSGGFKDAGTFQWTNAVKGMTVLILLYRILTKQSRKPQGFFIEGGRGSLASSLDFALSKQPGWLIDMFGADASGTSNLRRMVFRHNSNLKRPGPVKVSINTNYLNPDVIRIRWNGAEMTETSTLLQLLESVVGGQDFFKNSQLETITIADGLEIGRRVEYQIDSPCIVD
jgi:hypothetical protein